MSEAATIIHQHSRSFSLAARFLPKRVRGDVKALYAWCRTVDDVVDVTPDASAATTRLTQLKNDVTALAEGLPATDPASEFIASLIQRGQIDPQHAIELIEGMEMDSQGFQPSSEAELQKYCYHVAGTVGLMMSQMMGTRDPAAQPHAMALGTAMQLTNIARDVGEDALRGRTYLPDIDQALECPENEVKNSVHRIVQLAEEQYTVAAEGIRYLPRDCRAAVSIALRVYREIGREISRQGYPVLEHRVVISRMRLLREAASGALMPLSSPQWFRPTSGSQGGLTRHGTSYSGAASHFATETTSARSVNNPRSLTYTGDIAMVRSSDSKKVRIAQARSAVCLGLSLTSIMASVLFLLVFINPKEDNYGYLPLVYSGMSIVAAVILYQFCIRFEQKAAQAANDVG